MKIAELIEQRRQYTELNKLSAKTKEYLDALVDEALRLEKVNKELKSKQVDDNLDAIFETVDDLMSDGKFDFLDSVMRDMNYYQMDEDILIGWLTATLPAREHLPYRDFLLRCAIDRLGEETVRGL